MTHFISYDGQNTHAPLNLVSGGKNDAAAAPVRFKKKKEEARITFGVLHFFQYHDFRLLLPRSLCGALHSTYNDHLALFVDCW